MKRSPDHVLTVLAVVILAALLGHGAKGVQPDVEQDKAELDAFLSEHPGPTAPRKD